MTSMGNFWKNIEKLLNQAQAALKDVNTYEFKSASVLDMDTLGTKVTINGKTYEGGKISLVIDGKFSGFLDHKIDITVNGSCGNIDTASGDVLIKGSCANAITVSGDIRCGDGEYREWGCCLR